MSDTRQLVFNDHDTLGGIAPTIDGFALVDAGVLAEEPVESGYINAGRVTLGPGVLPPVVLQAVRHNNTLVLAISCRGDPSFDDADAVIIALRQNGASEDGPQRRIDIVPVWGVEPDPPYDPNDLGTGFGAANPHADDPNLPADEDPLPEENAIRTNKPAHVGAIYYRRDGKTGPWEAYTPQNSNDTDRYHARVRSWEPTVVPPAFEAAWGIEVRFPLGTGGGTGDWIDLDDDFGIFIDVIRAHRTLDAGDLIYESVQFTFPVNAQGFTNITLGTTTDVTPDRFGHGLKGPAVQDGIGVSIRNGALGIGCRPAGSPPGTVLTYGISKTVDNEIVAFLDNNGPPANGIKAEVRMRNYGLPPADFNLWDHPSGCQQPSDQVNLAAGPSSGETINNWPAGLVGPEYPAGGHQCMWVQLDATSPVVFSQSSARRNMEFVQMSSVTRDITISGEGYPEPAGGGTEHDFLLMTRCRKIVVKELVKKKNPDPLTMEMVTGALQQRNADDRPPGVGQPPVTAPQTGVASETGILLLDADGAISTGSSTEWQNSVVYLWITEGHRRTNDFLVVNGVRTRVLDNGPGDFGFIAHHEGIADNMNWAFTAQGAKMVRYGPGRYGVKVPHGGQTRIFVTLAAGPDEKGGDQSTTLPGPDDRPFDSGAGHGPDHHDLPKGCLGMLMGMFGKKH